MKRIVLSICLVFLSGLTFSQKLKYKSESEYLKKTYGKDKKELMAKHLQLSDDQGEKFWPIFDNYEKKRKAFGEYRWEKLKQYNQQYKGINDAIADQWMDTIFYFRNYHMELLEEFVKVTEEAIGAKKAFMAYQLESHIRAGTRRYMVDEAPFVGDGFVKKDTKSKTFD